MKRSATLEQPVPASEQAVPIPGQRPGWLARTAARLVMERMERIRDGHLVVHDWRGRTELGDPASALRATVQVLDPRFWSALALRGSVGAGEAYMSGWWLADDLTQVVRMLVRNRSAMENLEQGTARLARPLLKAVHALRPNTRAGSRRNIAAHYDLGNEFFRLVLDESLTYSCGIFEAEDSTLHEASLAKIDRLCRKLDLQAGDHLLEIGTGWGSFALHAAARYGCRVTTATISAEQRDLARERISAAGLQDRVEVRFQDYRDLQGQFDKLVSVEMIEAIGHKQFPVFFRRCTELLKPGGLAAIQAITIDDRAYHAARRGVDFIKRYIFPGCCIPSLAALAEAMARGSDLRLIHLEDITPHYARTLRAWRHNLLDNVEKVRAQGYSEEFVRMWEFYLCYCEGGFMERYLGDVQMLLARPACRRQPILPPL